MYKQLKKTIHAITAFIAVLMLPISLSSEEKMMIVVMDFTPKDVSNTVALTVSELIRTEMINTGKYSVIERSQMGMILKEQGFQQTGCTDISCAVKIGQLLSAKKILVGTITKLGKKFIINGRIVDIEKGIGEFGETVSADSQDDLADSVKIFIKNLSLRISGSVPVYTEKKEPAAVKNEKYDDHYEQYKDPTVGGKYSNLLLKLHCPADASTYGKFRDYGYYHACTWCGVNAPGGYWVWVDPYWYIWSTKTGK